MALPRSSWPRNFVVTLDRMATMTFVLQLMAVSMLMVANLARFGLALPPPQHVFALLRTRHGLGLPPEPER